MGEKKLGRRERNTVTKEKGRKKIPLTGITKALTFFLREERK